MTFEERLAALGVDLSDLPNGYKDEKLAIAADEAEHWSHRITWRRYCDYILHLTDVIDRMETRIINLTGELNYIKQTFMNCVTCTEGSVLHSDRCKSCDENYSNYEFVGVLEGWRPDDDGSGNRARN